MSTCSRLDLQTLGSRPLMPKNRPDHCSRFLNIQRETSLGQPNVQGQSALKSGMAS